MKITEILARPQPSLSFEVFPPKKEAPLEPVRAAVARLAKAAPSFISVTYGAAGTANVNSVPLAAFVQNECRTTALAHLTCVTASREKIHAEAARLREAGVENILALRGDVPPGEEASAADYRHAVDLVRDLSALGGFCLGGACYPEGHPACPRLSDDIGFLKEKVDAGLDFLTTQMFFDNNVYYRYLYRLRERGISVPVIAGVMPVTNGRQIARICQLSGTHLSNRFRAIVDRFGDHPAAMLDAGVAYATEQIVDLFANGVRAVHLYTMNRPDVAERIMSGLRHIIGA
jgi:methylenetetrahydrofolate reductase (NADPH)